MSDQVSERNLARYREGSSWDGATPFCLLQVGSYEAVDLDTTKKIEGLLERQVTSHTKTTIERACNIGECTLKISEDLTTGRTVFGKCRAASYCLKTAFEAVGKTDTVEEGKELYRDIMDSLEGHSDKYSAGNFCPRLDCGLSAGLSVDMVPGTAGECVLETRQDQLPLQIDDTIRAL